MSIVCNDKKDNIIFRLNFVLRHGALQHLISEVTMSLKKFKSNKNIIILIIGTT